MKKIDYNTAGAIWTMVIGLLAVVIIVWLAPWQVWLAGTAMILFGFGTPWLIMKIWNLFANDDDEDNEDGTLVG